MSDFTREQIEAMQPSRELDALVAEKVMGLEVYVSKEAWFQARMPHMMEWSEVVQYPAYWNAKHESALCVERYSTDIAVGYYVVEHMRQQGYFLRLIDCDLGGTRDGIAARFYRYPDSVTIRDTRAENDAEAICKAALLAVMGL
jgi:hypothetical protein